MTGKVFAEVVTDGETTAFQTLESEGEWIEADRIVHLEDMR